VLEFLLSKHQHYKIADPRSLVSQSTIVLNSVKYRFTKYNSHTEVNTVSVYTVSSIHRHLRPNQQLLSYQECQRNA